LAPIGGLGLARRARHNLKRLSVNAKTCTHVPESAIVNQHQAPSCLADRRRGREDGFTLIEVMITVAVVAILAAVALPSYRDYIRRGQIPEAFNSLSDYRTKMEQYYQDNRNYGAAAACANNATANSWNTFPTSLKYFQYTCATNTTAGDTTQQSYTITATGISGLATGHVYTIDQNGNRTTTQFKGAAANAACWLTSSTSC
jgi:type IV pilus assembly protein PilE